MATTTLGSFPARMNATDALFWLLDTVPDLRSTVGALIILDRPPEPGRLRDDFMRLAASYPRLRQRVLDAPLNLAPPEWVEDEQFDLDYHLRTIAVPPPGSMADLLDSLGPLFATPLDRDRPLWEAYDAGRLVDDRSAVFVKMHHCLMDGVGGTRVLTGLLGQRCETMPAEIPPELARPSAAMPDRLWRALAHDLGDLAAAGGAGLGTLRDAVLHPLDATSRLASDVRRLLGLTADLSVARADSPLHHERSLSRRLATFDMFLSEIDSVRKRLGATNNDIVLTVVSGALHRWHTSRGADVKELRALVPVNLRGTAEDAAGNRIALLAIDLPVGEPSPIERLRRIQERMSRVKRDRRATLYPLVIRLLLSLPVPIVARVGRQQMRRTNLVCTNVPGPQQTCYLAERAIERIYAFAPMVGDHPVAIALYSYRDMVLMGLDVDPLAMPDLPHFLDALRESYLEIVSLVRDVSVPEIGEMRKAHGR
jgi:diacylglycerol O-acyltransferase / wax synthase